MRWENKQYIIETPAFRDICAHQKAGMFKGPSK